ncbi:MAG: Cys-tRNA(Pro) deacylase [Propionibacteriaceae bacterium]|jgi:Cys-tRNA(Pro)/Cys-tRNA(Cys) deacylase|nr:Cys-tRNA(Pro) deacylase [Propionibacteriaceae bacterium]
MAKKGGGGTPALQTLDAAGVPYQIHEYAHDPRSTVGFGLESANVLGIEPERNFKTLMVDVDGELAVGCVPASGRLDLKAFAKSLGGKKAELADPALAERATGYIVGGISPLGQKRPAPTVIDETVELYDTVFVSGGRRGLTIELAPADLLRLTGAQVADIAR